MSTTRELLVRAMRRRGTPLTVAELSRIAACDESDVRACLLEHSGGTDATFTRTTSSSARRLSAWMLAPGSRSRAAGSPAAR